MTIEDKTREFGSRSYLAALGLADLANDDRLAAALKDFCAQIEAGQIPDRGELLQRYGDLQPALAGCLDTLEFLYSVAPQAASNDPAATQSPIAALAALGDFRILRTLGRGGMGVVYEAEQLSLGRRVALKVLPFAAMLSEQRLTRFQNEARAAATLSHPNIVTVFAVGVDRGVHYYAMELIRGPNVAEVIEELRGPVKDNQESHVDGDESDSILTSVRRASQRMAAAATEDYGSDVVIPDDAAADTVQHAQAADTASSMLSDDGTGQRSAHFRAVARIGIQAAQALDHAHQNGIVHRDIKPANLLLDATGHTWVTDFGLARIESDPAVTMTGDLFGTLRYMSPEQILSKRVVLDHRTDIYSLGLTLYELLILKPAFAQQEREELFRAIAFEEPTVPRRLNASIPVDLETIVLKAVQKNPADRYATAQDLADDLQRFLDDKPIRARRPTLAQRAGKWSRRHRALVASAVLLLFVASLGSAISGALIWNANKRTTNALAEMTKQKLSAERSAAESQALSDFLVEDLLAAARPENALGRQLTVEQVLDNAEAKIDEAFKNQPRVEASIRHAIGISYYELGDYLKAEPHLRRATEICDDEFEPDHYLAMNSARVLGCCLHKQGKLNEAQKIFERVQELSPDFEGMHNLAMVLGEQGHLDEARLLYEEILDEETRTDSQRVARSEDFDSSTTLLNLVSLLRRQGKYHEAAELLEETIESIRRSLGADHPETLRAMGMLVSVLEEQGKKKEAHELCQEVLDAERRVLGPDHPDTVSEQCHLAALVAELGGFEQARELLEETVDRLQGTLGPQHPTTLDATWRLAEFLSKQGKHEEAQKVTQQLLEKRQSVLGPEHRDTLHSLEHLAHTLFAQRKLDEACKVRDQVIEARVRVLGPEHPETLLSLDNLGIDLDQQRELEDARKVFEQVIEARIRVLGPEHPQTLLSMSNLARTFKKLSRYEEAQQLLEQVIDAQRRVLRPEHGDTLESMDRLADVKTAQGSYAEAEALYRKVLEAKQRQYGPAHPSTLRSMLGLANCLGWQQRYSEAEELARQILDGRRRVYGADHPKTLESMHNLAIALTELGRHAEAEQLSNEVLDACRRIFGPNHPDTLRSMSLLPYCLSHDGRYVEAAALYREVLEARRRINGPEHPSTLEAIEDLIGALEHVGKWDEYEKLWRELLEARSRSLGPEHPVTLGAMNAVAWGLTSQGKFEEARTLAQQALDLQQRVLGREHLNTFNTQDTLAKALEGLGHWAEARAHREEVLKLSGGKHDHMAMFMDGLALNIALTEDVSPNDRHRAIELAEEAVELDLENEESWRTLGVAHAVSGHWQKSLEAFEHALELGYRDELVPASNLERLRQSDDGDDDLRDELLEFLRENPGESQTDKRSHTNSTIGKEQDSDTE